MVTRLGQAIVSLLVSNHAFMVRYKYFERSSFPMSFRVTAFMVVWSVLAVFSLTRGQLYEWPDFVHVRYGIPFTYAVHTLSTLVGPADVWMIDINSLMFDLVLWFAGLVCGVAFLLTRVQKKIKSSND